MRILHVIPTIALEHGGPSHGVRMMASACAAKHDVEVIATSYGTPQGREDPRRTWEYREEGVLYRLFPQLRRSSWNFSLPLTRWVFAAAARYDVLHVHAPFSYPTLPACAAARHALVPYVYRTMGTLDPWTRRHGAWKKWPYYQLLEKRNLHAAAVVHVTSETERRSLADLGFAKQVRVVGYGVPLPPLIDHTRSDTIRILFVGRLHPIKGLPVLLDALAALQSTTEIKLELSLAGGGDASHYDELRAQAARLKIADNVRFLGFVHGEAKARLLAESDIFVLPSYHENFGVAAVEAMAAGLPAVVSDGVALAGEIETAGAGTQFPAGNTRALAGAVRRMLDPTTRASAGQRARQLVAQKFTSAAMGNALDEMYRSALDRSTTRRSGDFGTNVPAR